MDIIKEKLSQFVLDILEGNKVDIFLGTLLIQTGMSCSVQSDNYGLITEVKLLSLPGITYNSVPSAKLLVIKLSNDFYGLLLDSASALNIKLEATSVECGGTLPLVTQAAMATFTANLIAGLAKSVAVVPGPQGTGSVVLTGLLPPLPTTITKGI